MAKILDIADGLRILAKYDPGDCVDADDDEIWAGPRQDASKVVSEEDRKELSRLGWVLDETYDAYMIFP